MYGRWTKEGGKTSIRSVTHRMRERLLSDAGSKNCNLRHFRPNGPDIGPGSSGRSQRTTGRRAGARFGQTTGVAVSEDIEAGLAKVEYLIDFTSAEYTLACLPVARRHGIKLVIGTTGFSEQQRAGIEIASRALPIVL